MSHSADFFELIRSIGETKSKQEEDKIITREVAKLKAAFQQKDLKPQLMKELIVRSLYCEMLGVPSADFSFIHAVTLTSSKNVLQKRVGYLAITLTLSNRDERILLIIAIIQKDLKSTNYLEVSSALSAAAKVLTPETVPALMNQILGLKNHPKYVLTSFQSMPVFLVNQFIYFIAL